jgi:hypothetical protein
MRLNSIYAAFQKSVPEKMKNLRQILAWRAPSSALGRVTKIMLSATTAFRHRNTVLTRVEELGLRIIGFSRRVGEVRGFH